MRKCDCERSTGCPGGTHGLWSPPLQLYRTTGGRDHPLTKGGGGRESKVQAMPHEGGGTKQSPYGSPGIRAPRVPDDVGTGGKAQDGRLLKSGFKRFY